MDLVSFTRRDRRTRLLLVGSGAFAALALLYVFHLLYIQFIMLVWGGAIIVGISIYESATVPRPERNGGGTEAERWEALNGELDATEARMKSATGDEVRELRRRKEALELELMKLRWALREREMEITQKAAGGEPLRPIPRPPGRWQKMKQDRRDERILLDYLKEAEEVLAAEPPESALARVGMIAAALKAQHRLLGKGEVRSKRVGEYAAAWSFLASISAGTWPLAVSRSTSGRVRARLAAILDLGASRGLVKRSAGESPRRESESGPL